MSDTQKSILDTVLRIGERFGVPVLILAVLLWFVRDAAVSINHTVVEPVVRGHVEFLQTTQKTLEGIEETQKASQQTLKEIAIGQRDLQHAVDRIPEHKGTN
jgi:hypothetical protein